MVPIVSIKLLVRICVAVCGVALLASCSVLPSATHTTASARATPTPATPASQSQLNQIVLQPADLPIGWKGKPSKSDPSDPASGVAPTKCAGIRNTDGDIVHDANSPEFTLGADTVSSSATSYRSQSDLDSDTATLHNPKLSACIEQEARTQFATSLPAGTVIESVSFKITPGSANAPDNVVATASGTVVVNAKGHEIAVYLNFAFITGPLIEAEVNVVSVGAPLDASVQQGLVDAVATRAAQA